jgi:threonylcarbamoyladenosine tRNA methylthiotransferase MtaB
VRKIAFYTLGCKANQYQTEVLKSEFRNGSTSSPFPPSRAKSRDPQAEFVDFHEQADVYVINTCTVTVDADRKSRQVIRKALRQNPKAKVIVTGCYARLEGKKLKEMFPEITLTPSIPLSLRERGKPEVLRSAKCEVGRRKGVRVRANLMIQDGCEHFCSYCIVPYARGKIKSKPLEDVIEEAKQLISAGAREIVLTGINLATYQYNLSSLLPRLSSIVSLHRIRLSSLEPMYIQRKLIDAVAENPKACKHLHLPLQSGDNDILRAMNRNYSRGDYLELVQYIRGKIPDCGITTDIIVGFPGEGEKEFQNTLDLIEEVKFSRMHIFTYSKRKGTPAAEFPNQVDEKIKHKRNKILHELRAKYMAEFARQYLNQDIEILVEQKGEGLTSNYVRCFFNDPADSSGDIKKIFAKLVANSGEIRE